MTLLAWKRPAWAVRGNSRQGRRGGKVDWWVNSMDVHSFDVHGPFVAHDRFVVQYDADVSDKKSERAPKM